MTVLSYQACVECVTGIVLPYQTGVETMTVFPYHPSAENVTVFPHYARTESVTVIVSLHQASVGSVTLLCSRS